MQNRVEQGTVPVLQICNVRKTYDDIIMCIYQIKDGRLGYSTINYKNRSYNKYIVCTNENIDKSSLRTDKTIIRNYDNMGLNYMYRIVVNPTGDSFSYNSHTHTLHICTYGNIRIGYFLETSQNRGRFLVLEKLIMQK